MKSARKYTMSARADQVRQTRTRILEAALTVAAAKPLAALTLADVAGEAGVSAQTVLRQFESREGLLDAATEYGATQVEEERVTVSGDLDHALATLLDHYELRGAGVLTLLAQERWDDRAREITGNGRALHRHWVAEAFGPQLSGAPDRDALLDLLVVATDVYTWKLLRLDRRLSRARTHDRMARLVRAVLEGD
ncbi:MAG: helix-turn-helix domain-containing protein [Nocardioides sp.]|nr:helix-turn-helix domain-containing protein [Nocardioides sp.]